MDQKELDRTRYFELKKQLEEASRLYYKDGISPMSDQDFDFGLKEMEALEAKYPELRGKDSLTQRVGSDLTNDFAKVTHAVPMLSIANVYSAEEMAEFVKAAEDGIVSLDESTQGGLLLPKGDNSTKATSCQVLFSSAQDDNSSVTLEGRRPDRDHKKWICERKIDGVSLSIVYDPWRRRAGR